MAQNSAVFFKTANAFRRWLQSHHAKEEELTLGFFKKHTGKTGISYAEALDDALCFGWIDGVRRGLDDERYTIRFSPRRPDSIWSQVNLRHMDRLLRAGRVEPAGREVYEARDKKRSGKYSFEQRKEIRLSPELEEVFRKNTRAWNFFSTQAPWYRRTAAFWIMSAKKIETRERRLARLIDDSANEQRLSVLAGKK